MKSEYKESFEELFSLYAKGLLYYAQEIMQNKEEAEDIVQDVFVRAWEMMNRLTLETAKSYLIASTKNACLNRLKHLSVRSKYQNEILKTGVVPDSLEPEVYIGEDLKKYIDESIEKLPPRQRQAFIMYKLEGMTYAEIATELQISPRTVEKHVELAIKALKKDLLSHFPTIVASLILLRIFG